MKEVKNIVDVIQDLIEKYELTEEQQNFIRKYSQVRSAKAFEKAALKAIGNSELQVDWVYQGYYDTGYMGGGKCSMGHKLRYVHIARNTATNEEIKFGIKCVSDFFNLTKEQLRMIAYGVAEANQEILTSLKWLEQTHSFEEYVKMGNIFNLYDEVRNCIDKEMQQEIDDWRAVLLPLPYRLQAVINRAQRRINNMSELDEYLNNNLYIKGIYEEAIEMMENPKMEKHQGIISKLKEIINNIKYFKNCPDWQRDKLVKILNTDFDKVDELVEGLQLVKEQFNPRDFNSSIAKDIMEKYKIYGISDKQLNILEKVYQKYINQIDEKRLANC